MRNDLCGSMYCSVQVITTILKTMIDGLARTRLQQSCISSKMVGEALAGYRGINLNSKAKTPGDAWGGAEDGDKEESTVVIR